MVKNVTNLTIMNEDLHVFIPHDLDPLGQSEYNPSFEQFRLNERISTGQSFYYQIDIEFVHRNELHTVKVN